MTNRDESAPTRAEADAEFATLLRDAERGSLGPTDFHRCDELLPHVSPELRGPFGRGK